MNRLNLIVDMLNSELGWKLSACMYATHFEDEEKRWKIGEEIEKMIEEKEVWEGIRDSVRKGMRE